MDKVDVFLSFRGEKDSHHGEWVRELIMNPLRDELKSGGWKVFFDKHSIEEYLDASLQNEKWENAINSAICKSRGLAVFLITETFTLSFGDLKPHLMVPL